MCHLPEELVEEILIRLPSKSIVRSKSVCKSWYILISGKKFITKHLEFNTNRAKNSPSVRLLLGWTCPLPDDPFNPAPDPIYPAPDQIHPDPDQIYPDPDPIDPDLEYNDSFRREQMIAVATLCTNNDNVHIKTPRSLGFHKSFVRGSLCNGIFCTVSVSDARHERVIFHNPALNERLEIRTEIKEENGDPFYFVGFGFGYDSKADDYKYVRLLRNFTKPGSKALVYSLGAACWREIKAERFGFFTSGIGLYLKASVYWLHSCSSFILSFDLSEEKFHRIPVPLKSKYQTILVWNESIVYLTSPGYTHDFTMWIMTVNNTNGNGVSWTKHLTVCPSLTIGFPMGFWKEDQLLVQAVDGSIHSYNLNTKADTKLPIQQALIFESMYVDLLIESLVSVKPKLIRGL